MHMLVLNVHLVLGRHAKQAIVLNVRRVQIAHSNIFFSYVIYGISLFLKILWVMLQGWSLITLYSFHLPVISITCDFQCKIALCFQHPRCPYSLPFPFYIFSLTHPFPVLYVTYVLFPLHALSITRALGVSNKAHRLFASHVSISQSIGLLYSMFHGFRRLFNWNESITALTSDLWQLFLELRDRYITATSYMTAFYIISSLYKDLMTAFLHDRMRFVFVAFVRLHKSVVQRIFTVLAKMCLNIGGEWPVIVHSEACDNYTESWIFSYLNVSTLLNLLYISWSFKYYWNEWTGD